jgi:hypothetical protein
MADKAQRVTESAGAGIASQTGALAGIDAIEAQRRKLVGSLQPLKLDAGLLPAQAAAEAHTGAVSSQFAALTKLEASPGFKALTSAHTGAVSSQIAALTKLEASPGFKALTSAHAAADSAIFKGIIGDIGGFQSVEDRLRPLFENAGLMATANIIPPWLAKESNLGVGIAAAAAAASTSYSHQSLINMIRPISDLLDRVDHGSTFVKAVLGSGATNDAISAIAGYGRASAAVAAMSGFVKSFELPDIGLMTSLAATRSLFSTVTPMTQSVDRIGLGWASLGDRIVRGDFELAALMPSSNRLATRAYQLDIVVGHEDSVLVEEELVTTRKDQVDFVADYLAELKMELCERWIGMWDRMEERGPDWKSQAANSAVELLDGLLKILAPEDDVRDWQVASGKYNDPDFYLKGGTKGPTRRLSLFYLAAKYRVNQITVNALFMAVPKIIKDLQGVKHGSTSDEMFDTAVALLGDVITVLVPNRRR